MKAPMQGGREPWFRDRAALRFIASRFAPWFLALSIVWELGHARLYTIWTEARNHELAFAIFHCSAGDLMIALVSLAIALTMLRAGPLRTWRIAQIACASALLGTAYTIFSEWMNLRLERWTYTESMPTIALGTLELGLTPLLQWLVLPGLSLLLARHVADFEGASP